MSYRNESNELIGMCIDCDGDVYVCPSSEIQGGHEVYCESDRCENHSGTHIHPETKLPEWVDKDR